MLAQIEFSYEARNRFATLGREEYKEFQERFPELKADNWPEGLESPPYLYARETIIDLTTDGIWLTGKEIPFTVKRFKGAYYPDSSLRLRASGKPDVEASPAVHIQVAIPNLALLEIRQVEVLDDACTDELQRKLDEGWRILAICPPNTQRRPDYILGKGN